MNHRLALWTLTGFLVALVWMCISFSIPLWSHPKLLGLAELTCPITLFARFAIKWYWVVLSNAAIYLVLGGFAEAVLRSSGLRTRSG